MGHGEIDNDRYLAVADRRGEPRARAVGLTRDYGRVDTMRLPDGHLAVSELEVTEPGPPRRPPRQRGSFADLVVAGLT